MCNENRKDAFRRLYGIASRIHGHITPCSGNTWLHCTVRMSGTWWLWFNVDSGTTLIIH